jgi:hypothetical protein
MKGTSIGSSRLNSTDHLNIGLNLHIRNDVTVLRDDNRNPVPELSGNA